MLDAMIRQKQFYKLFSVWSRDTMCLSYHDKDHPNYIEIVAMGKSIIPLLLANLWNTWLPILALHDIVGEMPFKVEPEDQGAFDNLNIKWYNWGEKHGYI